MGFQESHYALLHLLMVVIFGLTFLHESQATSISRTLGLTEYIKDIDKNQMFEEKWEVETYEQVLHGRSDIEREDYPDSGANHSHEQGG
ncbi:hypothetical protein SUGI_1110480 [Cryptomeria japonica]|nr:hypothetical protein SUGI_1110480 [Cryptomeria japonica]